VPILVWSALPRGRETPYKRRRGLLPLTTAAAPQPPPDLAPPALVISLGARSKTILDLSVKGKVHPGLSDWSGRMNATFSCRCLSLLGHTESCFVQVAIVLLRQAAN
jgi:hypothetical protein